MNRITLQETEAGVFDVLDTNIDTERSDWVATIRGLEKAIKFAQNNLKSEYGVHIEFLKEGDHNGFK